ncbi:cell division cycle protein 20 homolog isoform X2 [Ischnura elegans]|uniref:cell division cycle protein 20 homolog isoform X2 n=1 Tax=Ischnura elegans TaxID=197161 RepID=UPI001ED8898F|nr:cell division cycle protein 20 homolog isoform X2 [Ischnura elegans]
MCVSHTKCLNISSNSTASNKSIHGKTPSKGNGSSDGLTSRKTPSKSPGQRKSASTPGSGKKQRTPNGGDRFIPNRSATHFDFGHFKLNQAEIEDDDSLSPSVREKQRIMSENLMGNDAGNRILAFRNKAPAAPEGHQNSMKVVYTQSKTPGSVRSTRYIPQAPERILDAPDILDDYYLNLVDWSPSNLLAVALGNSVYLWDAGSGGIAHLMELNSQSEYVSSLAWALEGNYLAVGISNGSTQLWDVNNEKLLRTIAGHSGRVGSLAWNSYILTSGSRSGHIHQHDVRQAESIVLDLHGHSQEVCGLRWSPGGRYLATGGNDNILNIWPAAGGGQIHTASEPVYRFSAHQAAVKALAWCPWQSQILASGGGTADRSIKFWNCNLGTMLNSVDTRSQVCSLLWSTTYKELVSGHGFANNQIVIWKYPIMQKVAELTGHSARVLHLALSPDGQTVLSAGADETLRTWKCFQPDPASVKKAAAASTSSSTSSVNNILKRSIR